MDYLSVVRHEVVLLECVVVIKLSREFDIEAALSLELTSLAFILQNGYGHQPNLWITLHSLLYEQPAKDTQLIVSVQFEKESYP